MQGHAPTAPLGTEHPHVAGPPMAAVVRRVVAIQRVAVVPEQIGPDGVPQPQVPLVPVFGIRGRLAAIVVVVQIRDPALLLALLLGLPPLSLLAGGNEHGEEDLGILLLLPGPVLRSHAVGIIALLTLAVGLLVVVVRADRLERLDGIAPTERLSSVAAAPPAASTACRCRCLRLRLRRRPWRLLPPLPSLLPPLLPQPHPPPELLLGPPLLVVDAGQVRVQFLQRVVGRRR